MLSFPDFNIKEKIFENQHTIIYKGVYTKDQSSVIIKTHKSELPTNREIAAYRKEFEITSRLQIEGALKSFQLLKDGARYAIVFEDINGISLKSFLVQERIDLGRLIKIFLSIAEALNHIHKNGIIHKDINPLNILIEPSSFQLKIIDFGISSIYSKENIENMQIDYLEGSIPYISPEQTGRMNRPIDYRTDFYSLGVTFYELLTGNLPFESNDSMDVIHSHIAKSPVSPWLKATQNFPGNDFLLKKLSELILKLLSKDPENRYQSASGICHDLSKLLDFHLKAEQNSPFYLEIGKNDFSGKLQIPLKLFGRDKEKQFLLDAFRRISNGPSEMLFIHGQPGVGKTALVNDMKLTVLNSNGFFIYGKYEEANLNIPYSAFITASREFLRQILLGSKAYIETWRERILNILGVNAKLLTNAMPELEIITGKLKDLDDLDENETNNRFHLTLRDFIHIFQYSRQPILIFLDNIDYADSDSFHLLEYFINNIHSKNILLICSYLNKEESRNSFLSSIKEKYSDVPDLELLNLKTEDVIDLVAETINYQKEDCKELANVIFFKTNGNPFFVHEFLKFIYLEKYLQPIEKSEGGFVWMWKIDIIRNLNINDDMADIVTANLKLLHSTTEELIQIASCLGNSFTSEMLSMITGYNRFQIEESLIGAVASGLILPSGNSYKFLHEKVQIAAYSLLENKKKLQLHSQIASKLLTTLSEEEIKNDLFSIINHLNLGKNFISPDTSRIRFIELNLEAGRKAKASAAYDLALNFFLEGIYFFESSAEKKKKELKVNLYLEAAEVAYLLNRSVELETFLQKTKLEQDEDILIKARANEIRNKYLITSGDPIAAINNTIKILKEIKINFPSSPKIYHVLLSILKVKFVLRNKTIYSLRKLNEATDPRKIAAMRLISNIGSAAYFSSPHLLPLLILENVYLSLTSGYTQHTPFSFSAYGIILCGTLGQIDQGYQFGMLALNIYEEIGGIKNKTKILHMVNSFIVHWKDHIRLTLDPLWECYKSGHETGDLEFAFYGLIQYSIHALFAGKELAPLEKEVATGLKSFESYKHQNSSYQMEVIRLTMVTLMEDKEDSFSTLDKAEWILRDNKLDPNTIEANKFYYHFFNLYINFIFGRYKESIQEAKLATSYSGSMRSLAVYTFLVFLESIALLQEYDKGNILQKRNYLSKVAKNQRKLKKWSKFSKANFLHRYHLIEAERNRVQGQILSAMDNYALASQLSKESEYINDAAVISELTGKFYLELDKLDIAKTYLNSALYYYHIWGADRKVKQLEEKYPGIIDNIYKKDLNSETESTSIITHRGDSESFNLASMVKVSETISREILLDKLLESLVKILIENAGAERGVLILQKDDKLFIEAEASFDKNNISVLQSVPVENADLPLSIINYSVRFNEYIVLNDAAKSERFSKDPYVLKNNSKSILCFPIFHKQGLFGIFYLENNLTSYAFKKNSVELLVTISTQSAISIENARLYSDLENRVNERTKELDESLKQQYLLNNNLMQITEELNLSLRKIKKDLALAKKVQDSILPKNLERIHSLNISTFYSPMDEVGGDFFDITEINPYKIRIFLADATGHGTQGALITMAIKSEYETLKISPLNTAEIMEKLNNEFLRKFLSVNAFFTCILLDIDPLRGKLVYTAAGHPPQILIRNEQIQKLSSSGKMIGVKENVKYRETELDFESGNKLFLYSDGIFEEFNFMRNEFGEEKLWEILQSHAKSSVSETLNSVVQQVDDFIGNLPQEDDMTFIGIEYKENFKIESRKDRNNL